MKLFRYRSSVSYLLIIGALFSCHGQGDGISDGENVRTELLEQINTLRKNGCTCGTEFIAPVATLQWNPSLEDAALSHADDMNTNKYFDHISLTGTSPIDRAHAAGYEGEYVGEVIATRFSITRDVIEAWRNSQSHCRALMDSLYNEVGGARKGDYWVVDLGKGK